MKDIDYIDINKEGVWWSTDKDGIYTDAEISSEQIHMLKDKLNEVIYFIKRLEAEVGEEPYGS